MPPDHVANAGNMIAPTEQAQAPAVEAAGDHVADAGKMVTDAPGDALAARVAALEAIVARLTAPARVEGKRVRSEAERRAVLRAWRMRREMRERADLDRRALEAANDAYRAVCAAHADAVAERDATRAHVEAVKLTERVNADMAGRALAAADAADRRAGRMVRAATRHRTSARRLGHDLRAAQAEARALARRVEAGGRARVTPSSAIITTGSGAVVAPVL